MRSQRPKLSRRELRRFVVVVELRGMLGAVLSQCPAGHHLLHAFGWPRDVVGRKPKAKVFAPARFALRSRNRESAYLDRSAEPLRFNADPTAYPASENVRGERRLLLRLHLGLNASRF